MGRRNNLLILAAEVDEIAAGALKLADQAHHCRDDRQQALAELVAALAARVAEMGRHRGWARGTNETEVEP